MTNAFPKNKTTSTSPHWYISHLVYSEDYGCETTALVIGQMEYFIILEGDHRDKFAELMAIVDLKASQLKRCIQYARTQKQHKFSDEYAL